MSNVFRTLPASEKGIFKSEDALSPEFLPESLPGREAQEQEIAVALKPSAEGGRPANLVIFGPSGTGKTSTCRRVLAQLREYSERPLCVYVNCWQHATRQAVLSQLAQAAGEALPRRGVAADEVFERTCLRLKQGRRIPVVVLDEADKLFVGGEVEVLYDFSRAGETYGVNFGIVLATNDYELLSRADARIRSSLSPKQIEFKPYAPTELKRILSARAALAFFPGACSEEVIALCVAYGAKSGGDARVALQALWLAGKSASTRGAKAVSLEDARAAFLKTGSSAEQKRERDESILPAGERAILDLLREMGGSATSADLYAAFQKRGLGSERSVRNYLASLEQKGLILTAALESGKRQVRLSSD